MKKSGRFPWTCTSKSKYAVTSLILMVYGVLKIPEENFKEKTW